MNETDFISLIVPDNKFKMFGDTDATSLINIMYEIWYKEKFDEVFDKINKCLSVYTRYDISPREKKIPEYENGLIVKYTHIQIIMEFENLKGELDKETVLNQIYNNTTLPERTVNSLNKVKHIGRPLTTTLRTKPEVCIIPTKQVVPKTVLPKNPNGRPKTGVTEQQKLRNKLLKKILDFKKKHTITLPTKESYINLNNDELDSLFNEMKNSIASVK